MAGCDYEPLRRTIPTMTTKTSTRYSSRNRTAADLEVLDQQFKNWLDSIAAVLGHRSTTRKGGVMMTGGKPYGLGTIVRSRS